ncbi:MAG: hypothetical protein INR68_16705 [Methylobacterium mesophilicum]|nr:hypothetical protein [Methylobacterium mesophilicum]
MHHDRIIAGEPAQPIKPNEPLTREQCAVMAIGAGVRHPLVTATDDQIAARMYQMFGPQDWAKRHVALMRGESR